MKELVEHLVRNHWDEIVAKSILNCHCKGVHSIMLLEHPEKTIRLFVADADHQLGANVPESYSDNNMTVAFHPHHCNLTLHCIKGSFYNWVVEESEVGPYYKKFQYHSQIKECGIRFERLGSCALKKISDKWVEEGGSVFMPAKTIHTVACIPGKISAWLVYEGKEDKDYVPYCYSNYDVNNGDFSELYKTPTSADVEQILRMAGLTN